MPIYYNMPTPPCPDCGQPMMVVTGRTKDTGELKRTGLCVWCDPGLYPLPLEEETEIAVNEEVETFVRNRFE